MSARMYHPFLGVHQHMVPQLFPATRRRSGMMVPLQLRPKSSSLLLLTNWLSSQLMTSVSAISAVTTKKFPIVKGFGRICHTSKPIDAISADSLEANQLGFWVQSLQSNLFCFRTTLPRFSCRRKYLE